MSEREQKSVCIRASVIKCVCVGVYFGMSVCMWHEMKVTCGDQFCPVLLY